MPQTPVLLACAVAGLFVGVVLRSQLVRLSYRLPEELDYPRPKSWWIIPATTALTIATWWVIAPGQSPLVPVVYVLAAWVMVPLAFIDLDVHRLPDKIQLPAYPALAALLATSSWVTNDWPAFLRALSAGAALWLLFFALALFLPADGIGFGDVKLAGLLGMLLGWLTWAHVIIATMATFLIGGLVAIMLLATRHKGRKEEFAYGPSMLLGAILAIISPLILRSVI